MYLGGSTYDTALTEDSAPASKRAWFAKVQVDTAEANSITKILWQRYFKANTEIANVVSITYHAQFLYILSENDDSTKFFLTSITNSDGTTRY